MRSGARPSICWPPPVSAELLLLLFLYSRGLEDLLLLGGEKPEPKRAIRLFHRKPKRNDRLIITDRRTLSWDCDVYNQEQMPELRGVRFHSSRRVRRLIFSSCRLCVKTKNVSASYGICRTPLSFKYRERQDGIYRFHFWESRKANLWSPVPLRSEWNSSVRNFVFTSTSRF